MATKTKVILGTIGGLLATLLVAAGGLALFIKHKNAEYEKMVVKGAAMSCTDPANLKTVQNFYLQQIKEKVKGDLKDDVYDAQTLEKWLSQLTVEKLTQIRTLKDKSSENQLKCEASLSIKAPMEMWNEADKADLWGDCGECEKSQPLKQYFKDRSTDLQLPRAKTTIGYNIDKSDDNEISVAPDSSEIVTAMADAITAAIRLPSQQDANRQSEQESKNKADLANSAMEIRLKELKDEQLKLDDQLNQIWNGADEAFKTTNRDAQKTWLDKRDIECKLESEKDINELKDSEKEPYQVDWYQWENSLKSKDKEIRFLKCSNERTLSRNEELKEMIASASTAQAE